MCCHVLFKTCIVRLFSTRKMPSGKSWTVLADSASPMRGSVTELETMLWTTMAPHLIDIDGESCNHMNNNVKKLTLVSTISSKTSSLMSQLNSNFHPIALAYCRSWRSIWEWNSGSLWATFLVAGCQYKIPALNLTMFIMYANWLVAILRKLMLKLNLKIKKKR